MREKNTVSQASLQLEIIKAAKRKQREAEKKARIAEEEKKQANKK